MKISRLFFFTLVVLFETISAEVTVVNNSSGKISSVQFTAEGCKNNYPSGVCYAKVDLANGSTVSYTFKSSDSDAKAVRINTNKGYYQIQSGNEALSWNGKKLTKTGENK